MKTIKHIALFLLVLVSSIPPLTTEGVWSEWSEWEVCSRDCGTGIQNRTRHCDDPLSSELREDCEGDATQNRSCNTHICPAEDVWSEWSEWEVCSRDCGTGIQNRTRHCNNPSSSELGEDCEGDATQNRSCNTHICPVHGNWSAWSKWSPCSTTCGEGRQIKTRSCNNPPPIFGGKYCPGSDKSTKPCSLMKFCPVNGKWSEWSPWSRCSKTCGTGMKQMTRTCTKPAPRYGGKNCMGNNLRLKSCTNKPCRIYGNWGPWSSWGSCVFNDYDKLEKQGYRFRIRSCHNPRPQLCKGSYFDHQSCAKSDNYLSDLSILFPKKVDGGWSEWSNWDCSNCFTVSRNRSCTNPMPKFGGKNCEGYKIEMFHRYEREFQKLCFAYCMSEKKDETLPPDDMFPDDYGEENVDVYDDINYADMYSD